MYLVFHLLKAYMYNSNVMCFYKVAGIILRQDPCRNFMFRRFKTVIYKIFTTKNYSSSMSVCKFKFIQTN